MSELVKLRDSLLGLHLLVAGDHWLRTVRVKELEGEDEFVQGAGGCLLRR